MYKMIKISAETCSNAGVSVLKIYENDDINKALLLLLCIPDISKRLGCAKIYDMIDKEIKGKYNVKKMNELTKEQTRKYTIGKSRLIEGSEQFMYAHEVIAISIIMQTRLSKPKTIKFRSDLGLDQINLTLKKEQLVIIPLIKGFSAEKIKLQHKALENERIKTDMYFSEHE